MNKEIKIESQHNSLSKSIFHFIFLLSISFISLQIFSAPGDSHFGRNNYIEYIEGDIPLIFSAPHGGRLTPDEIPDRTGDVSTNTDTNTDYLARTIADEIYNATGHYPHVIICHLKRTKIDLNRDIVEGAQGNVYAEQAWNEFHGFINQSKTVVTNVFGSGNYIDVHAHGHAMQWVELGYLISSYRLSKTDSQLETYKNYSSIKDLANRTNVSFAELIRGQSSFGALLQNLGYETVPSPKYPDPDGNSYFSGGDNTRMHGSRDGGSISGFQMELYKNGIRDSKANRIKFAKALAIALKEYLKTHYSHNIYLPPAIPTGLNINDPGNNSLTLSWNANTEEDLSGYNIYRNNVKINSSIITSTNYIYSNLTRGTDYSYKITAINIHDKESDKTSEVTATAGKPLEPKNIKASPENNQITLSWNANTEIDLKGYNIYNTNNIKINSSLITNTSYTITNFDSSSNYTFQITSKDIFNNESNFKSYNYISTEDHDNDGLPTNWELTHGLNPSLSSDANNDLDNDGATNLQEYNNNTKPDSSDTDIDGLSDGDEINTHNTNPLKIDTDGDSLSDYAEINTYGSNPLKTDTDNDGVSDDEEIKYNFDPTDPNDTVTDSDSDGLNNYEEAKSGTNPNLKDTDNDGVNDLQEILMNSNPLKSDTDEDDLSDGEEFNTYGTDPLKTDTDNDGFNDKEELDFWTNLSDVSYDSDSDNDGIINLLDQDSDNDGYADGLEFQFNSDPIDPEKSPITNYNTIKFTSFGYGNFDKDGGYNDFIIKDPYTGNYTLYLTTKEQVTTETIFSINSDWELLYLGDFDNTPSKTTDILWRNKITGEIAICLAINESIDPETNIINDNVSLKWVLTDVNDFNGDGKNDIVFRNIKDARFCFWIMNGKEKISMSQYGLTDKWSYEESTDLNGDGKSDIIFRNKVDARFCFWIMNGTERVSMSQYGLTDKWSFEGTTDIDGDNKRDIIFRNKVDARFCFWIMNGTERASMSQYNLSDKWEIVGTDDFNGDNNKDIIFRHIYDGRICAWFMNGHTRLSYQIIPLDPHLTIKSFFDYNQDNNIDIILLDEDQNIVIHTMNNWSKSNEINI